MTKQANTTTPDSQQQGPAGVPGSGTPSGTPEEQQAAQQQAQDDAQQAAAAAEGVGSSDPLEEGKGGNKAGQEAAKYRRQLRDTEAERDTLSGTVDALQRQLIAQSMPHGSKLNADSLWSAGHKASELFKEDGALDTAKLHETVRETHKKFGLRFGPDPVTTSGTSSGEPMGDDGPSWSKALNKNKR